MANILKAILWIIVLALVAFLVLGRLGNRAEAPTPTQERNELNTNESSSIEYGSNFDQEASVIFDVDLE